MKNLNFESLYKITVFLVFATLFVYILEVGQSIIVPLIISFFIAFLLLSLSNFLERYKFSRSMAAITCVLITVIVVALIFFLLGSQLNRFVNDLQDITARIDILRNRLPEFIKPIVDKISFEEAIYYAQNNSGKLLTSLSGILSGFILFLIIPIYITMILIYRNILRNFLYKIFHVENIDAVPKDKLVKGIRALIPRVKIIIQKYIVGVFYVICILFVMNSIALFALGIEHAMLFAAIAAVLNIIPFVGPFIGSTLPIMFALITKDSFFYPAGVMLSFIIIQSMTVRYLYQVVSKAAISSLSDSLSPKYLLLNL